MPYFRCRINWRFLVVQILLNIPKVGGEFRFTLYWLYRRKNGPTSVQKIKCKKSTDRCFNGKIIIFNV